MEGIEKYYTGVVGTTPVTVLSRSNAVVVKTLMLGNNGTEKVTVTVTIDNAPFKFSVESMNTLILDHPVMCNSISISSTSDVSVQASGISS